MDTNSTAARVASILNACYPVRYYRRPVQRELRAAAIAALGLIVRDAFNQSEDFEALLAAIVTGLAPDDRPPF